MLIQLWESRIGCHMNNVFIGDLLAYADEVTIILLNKIICNEYTAANHTLTLRKQ